MGQRGGAPCMIGSSAPLEGRCAAKKCVLGLAAAPPSVVLGRSWKSADAHHHELSIGSARSASLTTDQGRPRSGQTVAKPPDSLLSPVSCLLTSDISVSSAPLCVYAFMRLCGMVRWEIAGLTPRRQDAKEGGDGAAEPASRSGPTDAMECGFSRRGAEAQRGESILRILGVFVSWW